MGGRIGVGVYVHRPEFKDDKGLFLATDTLLLEQDRTLAVEFDRDRDDQHGKSKNENCNKRTKEIETSLEKRVKRFLFHMQQAALS